MTSRGAVGRAVIKNTYAVEWLPCNEQLLLSVHPPLSPWPLDLTFFRNDAASTSPHPPPPPPSFNNLPSDALVPRHRCLDAVLSPPLPPASRIRATLLGTIPELSWPEEWPTRSQTRFRFTCPLCISAGHAAFALFRLFRLVCRPPISHRDSIVYIHDGLASILSWCREVDRFCWRNVSIYIYSREIYFRVFSQEDGSRICYVIIIFEKDFYSSSFWIMLIMFWTIFLKRWIYGCSSLECVDKMDGWKRIVVRWKSERRLWKKIRG